MSLITYLTRIHFADRALEDALPSEMAQNRIARPLIVAAESARDTEGLDRLIDALPSSAVPATCFVGAESDAGADRMGAAKLLDGAACDGIIGFGGQMALDLARVTSPALHPVIAIPTRTDSIGLGPLGPKSATVPRLRARLPVAVLCDPTLTLDAPAAVTAAAGMNALAHCLESFLSTAFNPPADGIALDGLRRAARYLEAAVRDGSDITARREMLIAALDAGLAAEKGFGGIEAAAHGLESVVTTRHGVLHGALMPGVLEFNAPAVSDRYAEVRAALGLSRRADVAEELASLGMRVGLPLRLSDIGIAPGLLASAARLAAADPASRTNPRHVTERDYERIMRAAL